ncbi:MAG: hypothetical protein WC879_01025 [Melioribacteraceae bacterium]
MAIVKNFAFTYTSFKRILSILKENFSIHIFSHAGDIPKSNGIKPSVFLRHDVDLDLSFALKMATIERDEEINSCYMIMVNSPFYSMREESSKSIINEIIKMGHEIGLHFDFENHQDRNDELKIDTILDRLDSSCKILEELTNTPILSLSFHRPLPQLLNGPIHIGNRINAYSAELMNWYLSDSRGTWREGNPLPLLAKPKNKILQLLIHPIWWDKEHLDAADRLQKFYEIRTKDFTIEEKNKFDVLLSSHLSIQRSERNQ